MLELDTILEQAIFFVVLVQNPMALFISKMYTYQRLNIVHW